jgi:hypothetical protein
MASITPPRSRQTFTGHMTISGFVSLAFYDTSNSISVVSPKTHTSSLVSFINAISPRVRHSFHLTPPLINFKRSGYRE